MKRKHAIALILLGSLLCWLPAFAAEPTLIPCNGDAEACARTTVNVAPVPPPIPPTPVDCVTEPVPPGTWDPGMPTSCLDNQQFVPETRPLQIVTQPANGGTACPVPLIQSRTTTVTGCSLPPTNNWPAAAVPFTTRRIGLGTVPPKIPSDGVGAFRILCNYSHFNKDDAIALNGKQGASHLHINCGNASIAFNSTNQSLFPCAGSTSSGGIINCSAYWTPAMLDNNVPLIPNPWFVYYKSGYGGIAPSAITVPPNGLRVIAGRQATQDKPENQYRVTATFECVATHVKTQEIPDCPAGSRIIVSLTFPNCWDGIQLDEPATHRGHMAYSQHQTPRGCPISHPIPLPTVSYEMSYDVGVNGTRDWRLSSDTYPLLRADGTKWPGGYSMHGDWWINWDEAIKATWIKECVKFPRDCNVGSIGNVVAFPPNGQRLN